MQKHLSWYPWVMAALTIALLICIGLIVRMLCLPAPQISLHSGAQFVKEAAIHARV